MESKGLSWTANTRSTGGNRPQKSSFKKTRFDQKSQEINTIFNSLNPKQQKVAKALLRKVQNTSTGEMSQEENNVIDVDMPLAESKKSKKSRESNKETLEMENNAYEGKYQSLGISDDDDEATEDSS